MHKYRLVSKKGEGTFSEVLKAQSIKTGKYVAIKCMKNHFTSLDQVNNLREIQALRRLSPHPHIVKLLEIIYDEPTGRLALVFELMELNLYEWYCSLKIPPTEQKIKRYMYQLLLSIDHCHSNGIFHRDIKPENVLLFEESLKLADFGSCRGINSAQPYTEYISTRWYRPPECLLTDGYYNHMMDIWGVGCIFFEALALAPLFPGKNELDQVKKIHKVLGTPPQEILDDFKSKATHMDFNFKQVEGVGFEKMIPHVSSQAISLIKAMLTYQWQDRITPSQALKHPYFSDMKPEGKPMRFLPIPQGLTASEGDSAAGTSVSKDPMFPPIEKKKSQNNSNVVEKYGNKKKSTTLDRKSPLLGKPVGHKSPYGGKNFYKSYY